MILAPLEAESSLAIPTLEVHHQLFTTLGCESYKHEKLPNLV
jgi:hypothetical protein